MWEGFKSRKHPGKWTNPAVRAEHTALEVVGAVSDLYLIALENRFGRSERLGGFENLKNSDYAVDIMPIYIFY